LASRSHARQQDLVAEAQHWVDPFRVDPHNHYLHLLLEKLANVDRTNSAHSASAPSSIPLSFSPRARLFLRKRWAEFLTVISTAGLIPPKSMSSFTTHIYQSPSPPRQHAVVAYLIFEIRRLTRTKHATAT